jgi:M6 family metalloprotease-like protein
MKFRELCVKYACFPLGLLALFTLAAVPSGFAQTNPTSTQTEANSNRHIQLEGELEILNKDFKDRAEVSYSLKLANGEHLPMRFAKEPPTHLLTGDHVQAEGDLSNNTLVLYSGSNLKSGGNSGNPTPPSTSSSGPLPYTFGTQSTLVMLVNFQDDAVQPYTLSDMQTMFSGKVNDFITENSYGQTSIAPTVVGWYTIPDSVTTCNLSQIATDAQKAAVAAGWQLSSYTRYVYAFPQNNACGFAGSSYVGGNPSQSWINGNNLDIHVLDHELGHAFGLWHAHSLDCGTSATICSNGTVVEYGDLLDTMGTPQTASADYNAFQKERLGWLNSGSSPTITTVTSSGIYTIAPYEQGSGPNALKILKSTDSTTGAKTWYYVEARQAVGFDAFLSNPAYYSQNETAGVLFHIGADDDANSSQLIDMTPATSTTSGWWDPSLVEGQSFTDSTAGVTFTPTSVSSTGATVQITINGSPTSPSGPLTLSVSTNQSTYLLGQQVATTVTVFNGTLPDAGASVTVSVTPPSGSATTLTGKTGSNGVAVLNYKLSRRAALGTYSLLANTAVTGASSTKGTSTTFTVQ